MFAAFSECEQPGLPAVCTAGHLFRTSNRDMHLDIHLMIQNHTP